ncbi:hypothetical protein Tco_0118737, partial [Tanacetum coccineum]
YEVRGGRASVRGTVAVRGVSTRQYEYEVGVYNNEAVGRVQNDQNTPQIWIVSGCVPKKTKLPSPTLGYKMQHASAHLEGVSV